MDALNLREQTTHFYNTSGSLFNHLGYCVTTIAKRKLPPNALN